MSKKNKTTEISMDHVNVPRFLPVPRAYFEAEFQPFDTIAGIRVGNATSLAVDPRPFVDGALTPCDEDAANHLEEVLKTLDGQVLLASVDAGFLRGLDKKDEVAMVLVAMGVSNLLVSAGRLNAAA